MENNDLFFLKWVKFPLIVTFNTYVPCLQRCDYSALTKFLPPKHEFVISVKLSEIQAKMYECYLEKLSDVRKDAKIQGRTLFADFNNLRNIWTHPYICHTAHERHEFRRVSDYIYFLFYHYFCFLNLNFFRNSNF